MRKQQNEPLLVLIPETGEYLNIRPFITFLNNNKIGDLADNIKENMHDIDSRIKFISINFIPVDSGMNVDFRNVTDLYATFYSIRDMLSGISVLKKAAKWIFILIKKSKVYL